MKHVVRILALENPSIGNPSEVQDEINKFIATESAKLGDVEKVDLTPHTYLIVPNGIVVTHYAILLSYTERIFGPD